MTTGGPPRPHPIAWSKYPYSEWIEEGYQALADAEIELDSFQSKILKRRALDSLQFAYWQSVTRCAEAHVPPLREKPDELIEDALGRGLGVDRATSNRWANGRTVPNGGQLIASAVVVLEREPHEVGFPNNRETAWRAVPVLLDRAAARVGGGA